MVKTTRTPSATLKSRYTQPALDDHPGIPDDDDLAGLTPTLFEHVNPIGTDFPRVPDRRPISGKRNYALLRTLGDCGLRSAELRGLLARAAR